jgi:phosphoadenosine phosphosulfate reductase
MRDNSPGFFHDDKVRQSIDILKYLEPERGYWLAFSGGKDSVVVKQLAIDAGVKFEAHHNLTTLDPPEVVGFIRRYHRDVIIERPLKSLKRLCLDNGSMLPTRQMRFCCRELKEKSAPGAAVIVGLRAAESGPRAARGVLDFSYTDSKKVYVSPIFHWREADVWGFIRSRNLPYCELYDQGWKRVGCLFCPMAETRRRTDALRYPKHAARMVRLCDELVRVRKARGMCCTWETGQEMFDWWIAGDRPGRRPEARVEAELPL